MNIDDYLPKNITIKHGSLSSTFFELTYYKESIDYFNNFFSTEALNMNLYENKFHTILAQMNPLCRILLRAVENWQDDKFYRKVLQISSTEYKFKLDNHTKLLILYSFLDNQFFPAADDVLNKHSDKMMEELNEKIKKYCISSNKKVYQFTKIDFKIFTSRVLTSFFINCILEFLNNMQEINLNIMHIDDYINDFFIPYISICKSKYIRIDNTYKEFLYKRLTYNISNSSMYNFLVNYYNRVFYSKGTVNLCLPLKKQLYNRYNISKSSNFKNFYKVDRHWASKLEAILSDSDVTYLFDYRTNLAILHLFNKELNNISKLRYILFYYNNTKRTKIFEHIPETFVTDIIIKYNLTDIKSYDLKKDEIKLVENELPRLNEIISRTMLEELK